MANRTLTQLITGVRQTANVENNNFVTDSELTDRINEAIIELYELIVSTYEHYFETAFSFTLTGGQSGNSQALSGLTPHFFKDNTLEKDPGTSNMRIVRRLASHLERDRSPGRSYEIIGTPPILYVYPPEQSAGNYRLLYTQDAPVLVAGGDTLDDTLTKFYNYIQYHAAIFVHRKRQKLDAALSLAGNESDPQPHTLAWEKRRVLTMAHNRQEGPQQVPMGRQRSSGFWDWDDMP